MVSSPPKRRDRGEYAENSQTRTLSISQSGFVL